MNSLLRRFAWVWIAVVPAATAAACTQDFGIFDPDASTPADGGKGDVTTPPGDSGIDAAVDAPVGDAPVDAPVVDAGSDAPTCPDAGALVFTCGSGSVSDCSQCSGSPQPCVYCQQCNPAGHAGRCVAMNTSCFQGAPSGFALCGCANASTCPENYQVCRNGTCRTCSDFNTNNGLMCKGGGTCDFQDGGCN